MKHTTHPKYFAGLKLPVAVVNNHWSGPHAMGVARITKQWIVVVCNEIATMRFNRKDGYAAGAFKDRMSVTPSKILNLDELNALAAEHGGTWDSGWKPAKEFIKEDAS